MRICEGTKLSAGSLHSAPYSWPSIVYETVPRNSGFTKSGTSKIQVSSELPNYLFGTIFKRNDFFRKDHRFHQKETIVDMFSNVHFEVTQTCRSDWVQFGTVKISLPCKFAIERRFQNASCFSACWDWVLLYFQYAFWARPSVSFNFIGFWDCEAIFFDANGGPTFQVNILVSSVVLSSDVWNHFFFFFFLFWLSQICSADV